MLFNGLPLRDDQVIKEVVSAKLMQRLEQPNIPLSALANHSALIDLDNLLVDVPPTASSQAIGEGIANALFSRLYPDK